MMEFKQEYKNDLLGCIFGCEVFDLNNPEHAKAAKRLAVKIEDEVHPVMRYANRMEREFLDSKSDSRSVETKLIQMYTIYMAAFNACEITWDEAYYAYADFVAKLMKVR